MIELLLVLVFLGLVGHLVELVIIISMFKKLDDDFFLKSILRSILSLSLLTILLLLIKEYFVS